MKEYENVGERGEDYEEEWKYYSVEKNEEGKKKEKKIWRKNEKKKLEGELNME